MLEDEDVVTLRHLVSPEMDAEAVCFFEAVQAASVAGVKSLAARYAGATLTLGLPAIGEGDRGLVFHLLEPPSPCPVPPTPCCVKVAKPHPLSRQRLLEEADTTAFYLAEGLPVPRILYLDPLGRFSVKDFIDGETITSLYLRFDTLTVRTQQLLLEGVRGYLDHLMTLFRKRPDCKVSISPNNLFVRSEGGRFRDPADFVLIDTGPDVKKKYDGMDFNTYWNEILPDRIRKYRRTGYLQWMIPQTVTQSDRDQAGEFTLFRGMSAEEVQQVLQAASHVEFEPEEVILRKGAVGENIYLLLEGEVEVRKDFLPRPGSLSLRCGKGSVLGEQAFLLKVPRTMNVVAVSPCRLVMIDRDAFKKQLKAGLIAPYKLVRNIAVILAERLYDMNRAYHRLLGSLEEQPNGGPPPERDGVECPVP